MKTVISAVISLLAIFGAPVAVQAAGTFTYQGQLQQAGTPFNGSANFDFKLYSVPTAGTQIGPTVIHENQSVVNGLFQVELDFGSPVWNGEHWLEVRVNGTTLSPRQRVTATPKAINSQRLGNVPANQYALTQDIVPFACMGVRSAQTALPAGELANAIAVCPSNTRVTGGGCSPDFGMAGVYFTWNTPSINEAGSLGNIWNCRAVNETTSNRTFSARAICCGPGAL